MADIAYQNKDIASKVVGEALIGRSLAPFGLPHLRIRDILPTNLPAVEANELRLDNLFLLDDDSVAIIDYESEYDKENFVKYVNYAARIIRRYAAGKHLDDLRKLRIIVIYTADVTSACQVYDLKGIMVRIEAVYLAGFNSGHIYESLRRKILSGQPLTEEERMQLMILPLTVKGKKGKQDMTVKSVELARRIPDRGQTVEILAGILTFTDKVIDERYREKIKEEMRMTQIGKMIFDDGFHDGFHDGFDDGQESKLIELICKKMKKKKAPELIALEVEEDLDMVLSVCRAAAPFGPDYDHEKVFGAWKQERVGR